MSTVARRYTPEDLLTMRDGRRYELVDGGLVEKPMSFESDLIGGRVYLLLSRFCETNPVGLAIPETTYQCFPEAPELVRRPDASFIRADRVPAVLPRGHCRVVQDLAVEVISPRDLFEDVMDRVNLYLRAGVRLVWVINPRTRTVHVHRIDGTAADVGATGELNGEDVVPGFRCPVTALFEVRLTAN